MERLPGPLNEIKNELNVVWLHPEYDLSLSKKYADETKDLLSINLFYEGRRVTTMLYVDTISA